MLGIDEKRQFIETFEGYDKKTAKSRRVPLQRCCRCNQKSKHESIVTVVSNWCWYGLLDGTQKFWVRVLNSMR